jgi:4-hydroxy-tetrahydrodipicolinate reductase
MHISIVGSGKMGTSVANFLKEKTDIQIVQIYNSQNPVTLEKLQKSISELIIDCSLGEVFLQNLENYLKAKQKIVAVASNWYQNLNQVTELVKKYNGTLFYAKNYAIGSHLYQKMIANAVKLTNDLNFDLALHEAHHVFKKDYPSGVAKEIAQIVVENSTTKNQWECYPDGQSQINPETFYVSISRYGNNTINHDLFVTSDFEDIVITHRVRDRVVFAQGIWQALQFLQNKIPGIYNMEDLVRN